MANPQSTYSHPGPSTYYQPPAPQPPYIYGTHGPTPFYQYPVSPMNGHLVQSPSSPRMNPQGRNGYAHPPNGGPSYQNFFGQPQHPYPYPQTPLPHTQPPQNSFAPQHGKYPHSANIAYSPPYPPHAPGTYPPPWTAQQPLSPLPKQLSLLSPVSPRPSPTVQVSHQEALPTIAPTVSAGEDAKAISSFPTQPSSVQAHHSFQMESINVVNPGSPSPAVSTTTINQPSAASAIDLRAAWVVWSKRPRDPSHAFGVIISPTARPPHNIIQNAFDLPTPPASPKPTDKKESLHELQPTHEDEGSLCKDSSRNFSDATDVPSSSATETTPACSTAPDTPVPGSPISTNTSLSLAAVSPSRGKPVQSPNAAAIPIPSSQGNAVADEQSSALSIEHSRLSEASSVTTSAVVSLPAPKTQPKSWASLFRSSDSASSSKMSNSLPTSSDIQSVGYSADAPSAPEPAPSITAGKKSELLALLNSGPAGPASAPKIRPRGLINNGNLCFANAVLQVLVYCPPFWRLFNELAKYLDTSLQREEASNTPLVDATVQFLQEFVPKTSVEGKGKSVEREYHYYEDQEDEDGIDSFIPTYVYDALKEKKRFDHMRGGQQEDAEEFLGFYLDTLEEELLSIVSALTSSARSAKPNGSAHVEEREEEVLPQEDGWLEVGKRNRTVVTRTIKSAESPITRIFGGKFRSTLRAPHQKDSVLVEDWRSLRLDIEREQIHTIKEALAYISHAQSVQVTSATRGGITVEASQQVLIEALPPVLVLHLKRFLYDTKVGGVVKIGKQISFGPELEIGSDIMAPGRKLHPTRYKLFGVLYHHGLSASGGHYTLDVLHPNRDLTAKPREAWIRIDDELVSDVRPEDVFGAQERDDRCAYLLFYRRVGSAPGIASRT